jgi:hypothetical protein
MSKFKPTFTANGGGGTQELYDALAVASAEMSLITEISADMGLFLSHESIESSDLQISSEQYYLYAIGNQSLLTCNNEFSV